MVRRLVFACLALVGCARDLAAVGEASGGVAEVARARASSDLVCDPPAIDVVSTTTPVRHLRTYEAKGCGKSVFLTCTPSQAGVGWVSEKD